MFIAYASLVKATKSKSAVTRIRTWVVAATTQSTNHYTITADAGTRSKGRSKHKSHFFLLKIGKKSLPGGESNPGLPRDRRRYSPLYYRGWGTFGEQNSLLDSLLLPTTISRWIYRFSSDHRSQAASSLVSTWMGDRYMYMQGIKPLTGRDNQWYTTDEKQRPWCVGNSFPSEVDCKNEHILMTSK